MRKGWYYSFDQGDLHIWYSENDLINNQSYGPYRKFSDAKQRAIVTIRSQINQLQFQLKSMKQFKKIDSDRIISEQI